MSVAPSPATSAEPRRLRTDVALMLGNKASGLILGVGSAVIIARTLGPTGRGTLALAISFTMILAQFGTLGLVAANPYYVARDPVTRDRIVANSVWFAGIVGAVLIAVAAAIKLAAPDVLRGLDWAEVGVVMFWIPGTLLGQFLHTILLGEGRTLAYNLVEVALTAASLCALAVALLVFDGTVVTALAIMVAASWAMTFTYLVLLVGRTMPLARPDIRLAKQMMSYAFRIYVATLVAFAIIRVDLILVNDYLGAKQAGLYAVAVGLGDALYLIPVSVALNLFPRVARGTGSHMSAEVFRSTALLYAAACAASVALAKPLIHGLFGASFGGSVALYYWLAPGVFSLGMLNILAYHFAGRGFPREAMLVWFVGLGVNLGLNFALLPRFGTYIASLSSTVAYTLLLYLHMRLFARESGGFDALRPRFGETVRFVRHALGRSPA